MKHLTFCALGLLLLCSCSNNDNTGLYQEIKSVDKMVFASMAITKTVLNDQENLFGRRYAAYSYDTYMRAYIDLSSLQMDDLQFDDNDKTVRVTLPPVVAELTGRDIEMREVYKNTTGLRGDLDEKEIAQLQEQANSDLKKEIEENPMFKAHLTDVAKRKALKIF